MYLKEVVGLSDVALEGGATGVKPWPVGVGEVSVREEVITLGRPCFVGPIQLVQVTAGCGVQQVHLAPLLLLFIKYIVNWMLQFYILTVIEVLSIQPRNHQVILHQVITVFIYVANLGKLFEYSLKSFVYNSQLASIPLL